MGLGKTLLIGGVGVGAVVLLVKHSKAQGGAAANAGPPTPGPGAAMMTIPPGPKNPTGLTLTLTQWQQQADASGKQAGMWALVQNASNPQNDFVVVFGNSVAGTAGVMQQGTTPNSGLIAQAFVAGLLKG
jgi:hypothetical protein